MDIKSKMTSMWDQTVQIMAGFPVMMIRVCGRGSGFVVFDGEVSDWDGNPIRHLDFKSLAELKHTAARLVVVQPPQVVEATMKGLRENGWVKFD